MTDRPTPTSDYCATCDTHLSEFCWVCHGRMEKQRDDARAEVKRLRAENEALRLADAEDGEALGKRIDDLNFRLLKEKKRADDAEEVCKMLIAGASDGNTYDGIARAIVTARAVLKGTP